MRVGCSYENAEWPAESKMIKINFVRGPRNIKFPICECLLMYHFGSIVNLVDWLNDQNASRIALAADAANTDVGSGVGVRCSGINSEVTKKRIKDPGIGPTCGQD